MTGKDRNTTNGGGTSKAGQGTQRKQTAGRTRCACLFLIFLLLTDYLLQLPHPPNTKNARHTRVFRVRWLVCPSPGPQQPNTRACPCGHVLRAGLPPRPLLHSHPPQDTKNTRISRVFRVRRLSYPSPRPQHENRALVGTIFVLGPFPCSPTHRTCPHGHVLRAGLPPRPLLHSHPAEHEKHATRACFSCSAALLPQPSSPTRKSCPRGHDFRARALSLQPNTQNVPTWARSLCSAASLPSPLLSPPPGHEKRATCRVFFVFGGTPAPSCPFPAAPLLHSNTKDAPT